MKIAIPTTTLLLDIGGILLTNRRDHLARKWASINYKLEWIVIKERFHLNLGIYEKGKFALKEYLTLANLYQERPLAWALFLKFMFSQSKPYSEMLELNAKLKVRYKFVAFFMSSCLRWTSPSCQHGKFSGS